MKIILNGELLELGSDETVEKLLTRLKIDAQKIAVEVNLAIVPRSLYAQTPLNDGDAVEMVRFIGGG